MIVLRRVIPVLRCVIPVLPAPRGLLVFSIGLMVLGLSMCSESSKVEGARPGSPEEAPAQTAGHKRMVELLSRIGAETEEGNPFTGVAEKMSGARNWNPCRTGRVRDGWKQSCDLQRRKQPRGRKERSSPGCRKLMPPIPA